MRITKKFKTNLLQNAVVYYLSNKIIVPLHYEKNHIVTFHDAVLL